METKRNWQNMAEHCPELDGNSQNKLKTTCIVQDLGSVDLPSYPCRHVHASDLWCRRQSDVITLRLGTTAYHGRSGGLRRGQ